MQYGSCSLKFTGPRLWNSLPTSITNSKSLRIFRKTLKNSILNCYSNSLSALAHEEIPYIYIYKIYS